MAHRKEIIRICQAYSKETQERAHELSSQITVACRDGAGFAIPQAGRTSVAAISVFLASKQLKNGEVKERDACTASCLQPKIFKQALEIVKSALDALYENQAKEERGHFYANMLKEHRVAQIVALQGFMERTEAELLLHGRLSSRYTKPYDSAEDVVRATVFVWACDRCGPALHRKKRGITIPSIAERYGHDTREMAAIYSKLDNVCYPIGEEIELEVRRIQSQGSRNGVPSAQSSPTKSQKPTFPSLPSVFTPARSNASDLTPSNSRLVSPIKSAMRRKSPEKSAMKTPTRSNKRPFANEDLDTETDDTPSKPRKKLKFADDEADAVAAFHAVLATPRPLATPTKPKTRQTRSAPSSSKVMLNTTVNNANDKEGPLSQEIGDVDDAGHQSDDDSSHSDMEVEAYIDTTVPVKGGEEDEDEDDVAPEPSAPAPEQPEAPTVETPRRANRIAQLALTPTSIQRAPMTPTRKRGRPPKQTPTPKSGRKVQLLESDEEAEEETEAPPRRRYRPILLSHKQWLARDPRTGEQARRAETWKAKMVERYGYPPALDKLRSLVIQED